MKKLSRALKAARKARHWTQADLVQALRNLADADGNSRGLLTTSPSVSSWENGTRPCPETIIALIEVFPEELAEFAPKATAPPWAQALRRERLAAKMTRRALAAAITQAGVRRCARSVETWEAGRVPKEQVLDVLDGLFPELAKVRPSATSSPAGAK